MKISSLLAGTLALVIVAGLGGQAFAQTPDTTSTGNISLPGGLAGIFADESNTIYSNGDTGGSGNCYTMNGWPDAAVNPQSLADDFVLDTDNTITDVHFDACASNISDFEVIIYLVNEGVPGNIVMQTSSMNLEVETVDNVSRYWFDLVDPVPVDAGVTYFIEINTAGGVPGGWLPVDGITGNNAAFRNSPNWFNFGEDLNFVLTGESAVGGELLPIDSTSLILAGAQSFSFMIPVLVSAIGIGLFVVSRKSEQNS